MIKLVITNTKCKLEGLNIKVASHLTKELSFKEPTCQFSPTYQSGRWDGYTRFFTRPGNTFGTGLLPEVVRILKENNEDIQILDLRTNKLQLEALDSNFQFASGKILREYQLEAVNNALQYKLGNIPFIRGIVNIATNGGKTVISEAIMHQILPHLISEKKLLFLTHSKEIAYQSRESIERDLGVSVGIIGDGQWEEQSITVALVPTLYKNLKTAKYKALCKNVVAFVADESHHATSASWSKVINSLTEAYVRLGLTGTIPKKDIDKHKLFALIAPPVIQVSNNYLIKQGFSATPTCYFCEVRKPKMKMLDYQTAYDKLIVNNDYRNLLITQIVHHERKLGSNLLVLVERTEHGNLLMELISKLNIGTVEFTHGGRDSKTRKQILSDLKQGKINVLISTSVLDEGVDTDNLNAVVYARGMKSSRKLLQGIGRGLRQKSDGSGLTFYDFLDYTHPDLTEHTLQRYETVKQEKFKIKKVNFN